MPPGYKLPINAAELDALIDKMGTLRDTAKDASSAMDGLAGSTSRVGRAGGVSSSGGGSALRARPYRPDGPFGRASFEADRLRQLYDSGFDDNSDAIRNQRYRLNRAMDAQRRASTPPVSADRRVFNRTRFLQSDGSNPLGIDLAAAGSLGLGGAGRAIASQINTTTLTNAGMSSGAAESAIGLASKLLAGAGVAVAVGAAVKSAAEFAASSTAKGARMALYGGGGPGAIGQANALSGGDASRPEAIGNALRQGTYGAAYMHSKGLYDFGPYQIDRSTNYVRALDEVRNIRDRNTRVRVSRDIGLTPEEFAQSYADQGMYDQLKRSRGDEGSDNDLRRWGNYESAKGAAANRAERIYRKVATPAMTYIGGIAQLLDQGLSDWKEGSWKDIASGLADIWNPFSIGGGGSEKNSGVGSSNEGRV